MQYELFYLVGASKEAELDTIKSEVAALITTEEGVFEEKQVVEKRKMAYEIKHENRGFYVAQRFNLEDPTKIQAMTKALNLYTKILRSIITKTDELPALTSREERDAMAKSESPAKAKKETIETPEKTEKKIVAKKEVIAEAPKEEVKEKPAKKVASVEKKTSTEDIDKKLEEILNI
jgi:ribosomal protein S6